MWFGQVFRSVHQSVDLPGEHKVFMLIFIGSGAAPVGPRGKNNTSNNNNNNSPGQRRRQIVVCCPSWTAPSSAVSLLDSPKSEIAANIKGHLRQTHSFF